MSRPERVELLTVPDCPNADRVRADLRRALHALGLESLLVERVGDYPSPSVVVDGLDVMTARPPTPAAQCRLDLPPYERLLSVLGG